jgi:hypothetical protein
MTPAEVARAGQVLYESTTNAALKNLMYFQGLLFWKNVTPPVDGGPLSYVDAYSTVINPATPPVDMGPNGFTAGSVYGYMSQLAALATPNMRFAPDFCR